MKLQKPIIGIAREEKADWGCYNYFSMIFNSSENLQRQKVYM